MAGTTGIEWTETTWNPIVGCSLASPGCTNCYAMKMAGRVEATGHPAYQGLTKRAKTGFVWTGKLAMNEKALLEPLRWKKPRMVFVNSMGDLFHEDCTDEIIDRVFAVMALCPQHTFQVLTKRSARMREYITNRQSGQDRWITALESVRSNQSGFKLGDALEHLSRRGPLRNVWLGVSVEDQQRADERIPDLLATPAAVRWISAEPLLGPVNLEPWLGPDAFCQGCDDGEGYGNRCASSSIPREEQCPWGRAVQIVTEHGPYDSEGTPSNITSQVVTLDWVVAGGESGPGARPMHPDWARSLRDQCTAADVPFFFKQWGEFAPGEIAGEYLDPNRAAKGLSLFDGRWDECWSEVEGHCDDEPDVYRVGKKRAGRLLDGVLHDGMPT